MTISQRIFLLLKEKNLKQKDLAIQTGISPSAVSDWKKKGTNPAAESLSVIADFLGVSIEFLCTGKERSATILSDEEQECLEKFSKLKSIDKGRILDRMETLYDSYSPEEKEDVS